MSGGDWTKYIGQDTRRACTVALLRAIDWWESSREASAQPYSQEYETSGHLTLCENCV